LDRMTSIAAGSESMDVDDWIPSKLYLSVPLMWEILQFNSTADSQEIPTAGLLDTSLTPAAPPIDTSESSTLEIIVATSPEITINIADGGQEAPTSSYKRAPVSSGHGNSSSLRGAAFDPPTVEQIDSLTFNTTPWLYADPSQLVGIGDMTYPQSEPGNVWWEGDNFNNIIFNHFEHSGSLP
jgi:hypothetical protein